MKLLLTSLALLAMSCNSYELGHIATAGERIETACMWANTFQSSNEGAKHVVALCAKEAEGKDIMRAYLGARECSTK